MTIAIRTSTTWGLTWDRRRKDGTPILDSKGQAKRTGNRFFKESEAAEVHGRMVEAGRNPSPITKETFDWLCV